MASPTQKRIFGETRLELKLLLLFGIGLLAVIVCSYWWFGRQASSLVFEQNHITGGLLVDQFMLTAHYGAMEKNIPDRAAFVRSPEQAEKELAENRLWVQSITQKLTKNPNPDIYMMYMDRKEGPGAPQTSLDWEAYERLASIPARAKNNAEAENLGADSGDFFESPQKDSPNYYYYERIRAKQKCLECHSVLGGSGIDAGVSGAPAAFQPKPPHGYWSLGEVMAIARVTIPNEAMQGKQSRTWGIAWAVAIFTVFLAMVISYVIVRWVVLKPLRHLRDVSDSVTRGNITLRAEIRTGDEFEHLAGAFNRMLRSLVTVQDEIRQANVNLDQKVDELAQANMRLYEMNLIKSDFLATISHELRTPLNSILGFSEVLGGIDSLDDRQKRYVQNIQKSGRTLLEMINDILDLAKMESGKMEIRLSDFRIAQVVGAQCDMARPLAEKRNIDLDAVIPPELPPVRQDQARVQQILTNLLSNAIKFTPEGGRVTVNVRRDDTDCLEMQVIDTGVGIAEEDQQIIFEKFRQGRVGAPSGDAMTREFSGSGLGLSIVKELSKLLGGSVSVSSELGKGSTFTVRLPWTLKDSESLDAPASDSLGDFVRTPLE